MQEELRAEDFDEEPEAGLDAGDDEEELDEEAAPAFGDDEEPDDSSLDELLAKRSAARRGSDDADDDDTLLELASEKDVPGRIEPFDPRVVPVKDRREFVCKRCFLVKARSQLADPDRMLCRDCV